MKLTIKNTVMLLLFPYSIALYAEDNQQKTIQLQNLLITENNKPEQFFIDQPYSGNVFVLKDIEEHGIKSVQDVTTEIPNFNYLDFGLRSYHSILGVRGLTNTAFYSDPSVILYIDDIPYGSAFSYINQTNGIESIEVYRGPQGALFGKNSYGGVFNVRSRRPENSIKTHVSAEYARFNSWSTEGYVDGAIIKDTLFFSLGGSYAYSDGYLYNNFLNNTPDKEEHISGHATLIWKPSPKWELSLIANGDDLKDARAHITPLSSPDPLVIQSDENGKLEQGSNTQALRISFQNNGFQFLSVSSRRDWELNPFFTDADGSSSPLFTLKNTQRQTQWNQEFRLSSHYKNSDWSIGAFASTGKIVASSEFNVFGTPVFTEQGTLEEEHYALFANLTQSLSDSLRLHFGIRLDYFEKRVDRDRDATARLIKESDFIYASPKVSIDYLITNKFLLYSSTGLAFKPGGFSLAANSEALSEFDSERMWANELGFKSQWLDDKIKLNMAFFYYQIDNYQVERDFSQVDYTIINADKVTSYGLELESNIELMPGLKFEASFGYTHIRFDEFIDSLTTADLSGNSPSYIPEKTVMVAAQYKYPNGVFIRSEWRWNDKTYFDDANSNAFKENDYYVLNARLGYQSKHFNLYFFGENLTNNQYYHFKQPIFNSGSPAKPRSLGIRTSLDF